MLLKKYLILTNGSIAIGYDLLLQLLLAAKLMQLQKKSAIVAANSVTGLVVTTLGFTSSSTRHFSCLQAATVR